MKKPLVYLLSIFALIGSFLHPTHAKSTLDLRTAGLGARAIGMGRAYVASVKGADAVFQNPAALSGINSWNITSMSTKVMDRADYKMFGGAMPYMGGVVGLGYLGVSTPAGYLTTDYNSLQGALPISYGSSAYTLAYAADYINNISWGASVKLSTSNVEGYNASAAGLDADLGILVRPKEGLVFGAVMQNVLPKDWGASSSWNTGEQEEMPGLLKAGASYNIRNNLLLAADVDINSSNLSPFGFHGGLEWKPIPYLALRAGYDGELALGVGVNVRGFNFDYAYRNNSVVENNNSHYFSISFAPETKPANLLEEETKLQKQQKEQAELAQAKASLFKLARSGNAKAEKAKSTIAKKSNQPAVKISKLAKNSGKKLSKNGKRSIHLAKN